MATRVVTIFGGSGFVGRYVVQRLARKGWVIRVGAREPSRAQFLKPLGSVGRITPLRAPLQDESAVRAAVRGVDAVINLVGILHERGRQTFDGVQHRGAATVAAAAAAAGIQRIVQMSAIGADANSESAYARSKAAGERAVRELIPGATIIRPSIVVGAEDGFFNRFAVIARLSPVLPLIGGGETRFQPVYVADVAEAIVKAVEAAACAGNTYELGGPRVYTFRQLIELMLRQIRRRRLLVSVPFAVADLQAAVLQLLPDPPLTRDQVKLLRRDNVVSDQALTFADLGIRPTAIEAILSTYLDRYRPGGRFREWATP